MVAKKKTTKSAKKSIVQKIKDAVVNDTETIEEAVTETVKDIENAVEEKVDAIEAVVKEVKKEFGDFEDWWAEEGSMLFRQGHGIPRIASAAIKASSATDSEGGLEDTKKVLAKIASEPGQSVRNVVKKAFEHKE